MSHVEHPVWLDEFGDGLQTAMGPALTAVALSVDGQTLTIALTLKVTADPERLMGWLLRGLGRVVPPELKCLVLELRLSDDRYVYFRRALDRSAWPLYVSRATAAEPLSRAQLALTAGFTLACVLVAAVAVPKWMSSREGLRSERGQAGGGAVATAPGSPGRVAKQRTKAARSGKKVGAPPLTAAWVEPDSVGKPYGDQVDGLLTFRGNPTRTYYGKGPVPTTPRILWRYPERPMCALSKDRGVTMTWCGTGWTGQPAVFERQGRTWVTFGAFDRSVHFVDGASGRRILAPYPTGDIIKGSVTVDPDGFPIVYSGSRDGFFRALAFDGPAPRELWRLAANRGLPTLWNDDWDGSALVLRDHLFIGGENSRLHIVRLNRSLRADGKVSVAPKVLFDTPGWDDRLLRQVGDRNVSIENSPAIFGNNLYFSNSGGLAQVWDIGELPQGRDPRRTFRYWTGDDTDASIVVDDAGSMYVASEFERANGRSREVGQLVRLDPARKDPLVWSVAARRRGKSGIWGTPALYRHLLVFADHDGLVRAVDRANGRERWRFRLRGKTWQSPVIVDDVLIQGDCSGDLSAFALTGTAGPPRRLWTVNLGGCIESTPAVWNGRIYVGSRSGFMYAIGESSELEAPSRRRRAMPASR